MYALLQSVVSFALPPRCAGCGQVVGADLELCAACWQSLEFLTGKGCELCGAPIALHLGTCGPCLARAPDHDGAYAVVAYGEIARTVVLKLKHSRRIGMSELIAKLLVQIIPEGPAVLIPVPAHRWRIFRRGFNQSALIAGHLAKSSGLALDLDSLSRKRQTVLLRGASARDRARIVRGAFAVAPQARSKLTGQTVLLVDDVYTSGATANACARELKRAGVHKVIVLCWARVVRGTVGD